MFDSEGYEGGYEGGSTGRIYVGGALSTLERGLCRVSSSSREVEKGLMGLFWAERDVVEGCWGKGREGT